jgi:cell division protein FtsN
MCKIVECVKLKFEKSKNLNETLLPDRQKESWQTFEEASGQVRPERVNKWPNSMRDR